MNRLVTGVQKRCSVARLTSFQDDILRASGHAVLGDESVVLEMLRRDLSNVQLRFDRAVTAILHAPYQRLRKILINVEKRAVNEKIV